MPGSPLELEVVFWSKFKVHFWTPEVPQNVSKSICILLRTLLGAVPEKEDLYQGILFYQENLDCIFLIYLLCVTAHL